MRLHTRAIHVQFTAPFEHAGWFSGKSVEPLSLSESRFLKSHQPCFVRVICFGLIDVASETLKMPSTVSSPYLMAFS